MKRSWYIGLFQLPLLAPLAWRHILAERWPATLARLEGEALPVAPTWREDGRHGIKLYRANVAARLFRPRQRPAVVPVHAIAARRDPLIGRSLVDGLSVWASNLEIADSRAATGRSQPRRPT